MRLPQKQKIKVTIATTPADAAAVSPVGKRPSKEIVCITAKSDRWVVWHHVPEVPEVPEATPTGTCSSILVPSEDQSLETGS